MLIKYFFLNLIKSLMTILQALCCNTNSGGSFDGPSLTKNLNSFVVNCGGMLMSDSSSSQLILYLHCKRLVPKRKATHIPELTSSE